MLTCGSWRTMLNPILHNDEQSFDGDRTSVAELKAGNKALSNLARYYDHHYSLGCTMEPKRSRE